MKLVFLIVFAVSAGSAFSQAPDKSTQLLDSLSKIDIADNLYMQIENLKSYIKNLNDDTRQKWADCKNLEEFCIRQDVYRILFDNLESGYKPGADQLFSYYNTVYQPLFEIPDSAAGFPITIYYKYVDTAEATDGKEPIGKFPLTDFARKFLSNDTLLTKRYPKVYDMMKKGKIVFETADLKAHTISALQIPEFNFPAFYLKNNALDTKKALANDLLEYILQQGPALISYLKSNGHSVDGDLIQEYQKLEREKFAKATLDEKIRIRRKFIEYLKLLYNKYE